MKLTHARKRLQYLEALIHGADFLRSRFGDHATLGELNAALIGHRSLLKGEMLTVSELADRSGQNKQSISRWLRRVPFLTLRENPNDSRSKFITARDYRSMESMVQYLDDMIESDSTRLKTLVAEQPEWWGYIEDDAGQGSSRV